MVTRRAANRESGDIDLGACTLDPMTRKVGGPQGEAEVSPIAARFLVLLADHGGRTISRQAFVDALWAGNHLVGDPALNRVVSEVRRAIRATVGETPVVETVHGRGYRLFGPSRLRATALRPRRGAAGASMRRRFSPLSLWWRA